MQEIEITVENGEIVVDWWTPESGDLICDICGKCEGWRKVQENWFKSGSVNTCPHANPYCG
jgi:hypothetical protein